MKNEWISVDDRLPEIAIKSGHSWLESKRVLLWVADSAKTEAFGVAIFDLNNGFVCFSIDGFNGGRSVTHWMPLPEPPKGKAE